MTRDVDVPLLCLSVWLSVCLSLSVSVVLSVSDVEHLLRTNALRAYGIKGKWCGGVARAAT